MQRKTHRHRNGKMKWEMGGGKANGGFQTAQQADRKNRDGQK